MRMRAHVHSWTKKFGCFLKMLVTCYMLVKTEVNSFANMPATSDEA